MSGGYGSAAVDVPQSVDALAGLFLGQRVRVKGKPGSATVRWVGSLPTKEPGLTWVGIEYDQVGQGKHDGCHNDVRKFECEMGKGSFAKRQVIDVGVSLLIALKARYCATDDAGDEPIKVVDYVTNREMEMQFVGKEGVQNRKGNLASLEEATLIDEDVSCAGEIPEDLNKLTHLNLDGNLLSTWEEVAYMCERLPLLRELALNRNKMMPIGPSFNCSPCTSLKTLALNDTGLSWAQVRRLGVWLPSLEVLYACDNALGDSPEDVDTSDEAFVSLRELCLDRNAISGWVAMDTLKPLPKLEVLQLNGNHLSNAPEGSFAATLLPKLRSLSLDDNRFKEWGNVGKLCALLPSLSQLRMQRHPLSEGEGAETSPKVLRQVLIAVLAELKVLNASEVMPRERVSAERQFLSFALRGDGLVAAMDSAGVHLERLRGIHGEVQAASADLKAEDSSLSGQLVALSLKPMAACILDKPKTEKRVPASMTIGEMKVLCHRIFKSLPVEKMSLSFAEPGAAVPFKLDDDFRDLSFFGLCDGCEILVHDHSE